MSRLIIKAMFHRSTTLQKINFQPDPVEFSTVEVSVTSVYGVPKKSLQASNFKVSLIASPVLQDSRVTLQMNEKKEPGFYSLLLSLVASPEWPQGEYIFAIVVQSPTTKSVAQGQTLVGFTR